MRRRLTDQAAVAVALARTAARGADPTVAHLLVGLAAEPEGRAGRRLRERATAAALLADRAHTVAAPPLQSALTRLAATTTQRAADTVDLLDAALAEAGSPLRTLLVEVGYHRDLDGWLTADPATEWFEDAETYGLDPGADDELAGAAARVVAQVRAVDGGAVALLIASAAAPDADLDLPDPRDLAAAATVLGGAASGPGDAGLDAVVRAARSLAQGPRVTVGDLWRAALVAGGDAPRLVLEFAHRSAR